METSDQELLKRFVKDRSEPAFRRMVDRHLNLVFATARRIVGSPQLAEEIAQGVFTLLARKAGEIRPHQPLAGWLYHTSRHHALNTARAEGRRRQREHNAAIAMEMKAPPPEPAWIAAELEDAMDDLPTEDRDALVLRFLDNRPLREVGTELGISEEAARKRVGRALEKLRGIFGKRGVALSAGLLSTTLTGQAATVAPAALGATITATALSQLAAVSTATIATIHTTSTMTTLFNLKTAAVVLGVAAVTGTSTYLVKKNEADRLRTENRTLNQSYAGLTAEQQQATAAIQLRDEEIARLKKDIADLPRVRGEVDRLTRELIELTRIKAENIDLQERLEKVVATNPEWQKQQAQELYREQTERKKDSLRPLGFMYRRFLRDHPGEPLPESISGLIRRVGEESDSAKDLFSSGFSYSSIEDYEVLYPAHLPKFEEENRMDQLPILKERRPVATPDGKWSRIYLFGDGSPVLITKNSIQELAAWESEWLDRIGLGDLQR